MSRCAVTRGGNGGITARAAGIPGRHWEDVDPRPGRCGFGHCSLGSGTFHLSAWSQRNRPSHRRGERGSLAASGGSEQGIAKDDADSWMRPGVFKHDFGHLDIAHWHGLLGSGDVFFGLCAFGELNGDGLSLPKRLFALVGLFLLGQNRGRLADGGL